MGDDEEKKRISYTIVDQPGMTSVVTREYLILPFTDIAVNKKFFQFWTVFVFIATGVLWAIGVWTDWYWQILVDIGMLFWTHWWLTAAVIVAIGLVIYVSAAARKKGRRKEVRK